MVLPEIHQRFLKLFGATFFKPEKMANIMESTRQKTFTPTETQLFVAAVLTFIILIYPALSAAGQYKVGRRTDLNIGNYGDDRYIRIFGVVYFNGAN